MGQVAGSQPAADAPAGSDNVEMMRMLGEINLTLKGLAPKETNKGAPSPESTQVNAAPNAPTEKGVQGAASSNSQAGG